MNESSSSTVRMSVLQTLAYFDIFEYPLTPFETWRWLYVEQGTLVTFLEVQAALDGLCQEGRVSNTLGWYGLVGREQNVEVRHERYLLAQGKMAVARRAAAAMRWLPFVEFFGVCNKLGYANTPAEGDIDVLIVVRRGRLWLTRLWVTLVVSILGIRRHGTKIANRICLSFYITDDHLGLQDIARTPDDPYLRYYLATLLPLYQRRHRSQGKQVVFPKLIQENAWTLDRLPNFFAPTTSERWAVTDSVRSSLWWHALEWLLAGWVGSGIEQMCRNLQRKKMRLHDLRQPRIPEAHVVISDTMLKFHEYDRRPQFREAWLARLSHLI